MLKNSPAGAGMPSTDWLELSPRLRTDLVFRPQQIGDARVYVVEDPVRTKFFRLGTREYQLAAAWDGQTSIREILCRANQSLGKDQLTEQDALMILHWTRQNDLLELQSEMAPTGQAPESAAAHGTKPLPNPIIFRLPLGSPDRMISRCYPYLAWIFSPSATALGLLLIAGGLAAVIGGWDRLIASADAIFSPQGQVSLLVSWIVLKVIHEFSHGLACRRYGGTVREAGILFILLLPLAYVDVTSSWRIRNRWHRIHIAAAGMQMELYLASLAALGWSFTSPGLLHQFCANLFLMASVTTILFNANPLMRFDGYFILTDLLNMPNLAVTSQAWLRGWARQCFFGIRAASTNRADDRLHVIRLYAVAAMLWRIFVCISMIVTAAVMWHGAGIVLALFAVGLWFGLPLLKLFQILWAQPAPGGPSRERFAMVTATVGLILATALTCLPWPGATNVPGIVDYEPLSVIRSEVDGFVAEVLVRGGESVTAGQQIARVQNDELQRDLALQRIRVKASRLRIRGLRGRRELAALEAETHQLAALEEQLAELVRRSNSLTLRAPVAGRVVSRHVESLVGTYLHQGDVLMSIGNEHQKHIEVSIPQAQLAAFEAEANEPVVVSVAASETFACRVERLDPRATLHPLDQSLCAPFGGDLLVRQSVAPSPTANQDHQLELLKPHFVGRIPLTSAQSKRFRSGQRARVTLGTQRDSVGGHLWSLMSDWLRKRTSNLPS